MENMSLKRKNRIASNMKQNPVRRFNADQWLTEHFEELVDKYAGRYLLIVEGKILYTDKDGSPREIAAKAKARFPKSTPFFFRVPRPKDFLCALNAG
jgi:hypothetical protein